MHIRLLDLPGDLAAVDQLLGRVKAVDGHQPIGENKYLMLLHGDPEKVVGLVAEVGGRLVSFIALTANAEPGWWSMELAVDPEHRSPETDLDLFNAGATEVTRRGAKALRAWLFERRLVEAAGRAGFEPERELLRLKRQLPGGFKRDRPDANLLAGMHLASFVPGHDEQAWLEVNNAAFVDHPENGRWTLELLANRMGQQWFRPDELIMAWDGSSLAGFCWVKRGDGEGEIYVVAVAPKHQGAGLGRALVLQGLSIMEEKGDRVAFLYVDATNHRALALYRSLGFFVDHVDRSFVRMLV